MIRGWKYDADMRNAETSSVDRYPRFLQYPSSGRVDCGPTTGRCLPVHYMTLDGRPLSPQNIPYIKTGKAVELEVVRSHLKYKDGDPDPDGASLFSPFGDWASTGELTLKTDYPMRASFNEGVSCSSTRDQTLYIDSGTYRPSQDREDEDWRDTTVYIKLCRDTRSSEEDDALLEFFPREARYGWRATDPSHQDGGRVRHYQNFKSDSCHATRVAFPQDLRGALLGTDCLTTRTHGGYADFYTFTNPRTQTVTIDLENEGERLDTYLYLVRGSSITGSEVDHDDDSGDGSDSHLEQSLRSGAYTVIVTNYGRGRSRTGDYRLRIRAGAANAACSVTPITDEETDGRWSHSDCESSRRSGSYVDYYTFEVTGARTKRVQIDLDSRTDSYLYLISGTSPAGTAYIEGDDDDGPGLDARIRRDLWPGHYTIAATTYGEDATGSYTLEVDGHD